MKRSENKKKQISETLKDICKESNALIIGLTGGIATGKTTVADIFREFGAGIIDFDLLARNVVEPGRRSWKLITDYFGKDILNSDSTLNRKKLSGIVFDDPLKRKKLESFTHPLIWDEFLIRVEKSVRLDRNSIIHAVIPLLIEGNMHELFMKNIVVYASPDVQIKRIMARDGISLQMAEKILKSQMPIEDKIKYGDYVVKNEGSFEDIKKETSRLWKILKKIQENIKT